MGRVYPTQIRKHGQRVAIAILHPTSSAVKAVSVMNRPLENAVLVVTAVEVQKQMLEKKHRDMAKGFVKFFGERAPFTDVLNTLMITDSRKVGYRWHQELANVIVEDFLFAPILEHGRDGHHRVEVEA